MTEHVTDAELTDWRYQCEERLRRWANNQAVIEWKISIRDTLRLLNELRAQADKVASLTDELNAAKAELESSIDMETHEVCCEESARQAASCNMDHHAEAVAMRAVLADAIREVVERDHWDTEWWAEDWIPRAVEAVGDDE